jgi:hypothetical protein
MDYGQQQVKEVTVDLGWPLPSNCGKRRDGNCKLSLPSKLKINPWFATDKLKLYQSRDGHYPSPLIEDKEKEYKAEYEVDQVLDYDHEKDRDFVSWKGYGPADNQWERAAHLPNAPDKTADYGQYRSQNSSVTVRKRDFLICYDYPIRVFSIFHW